MSIGFTDGNGRPIRDIGKHFQQIMDDQIADIERDVKKQVDRAIREVFATHSNGSVDSARIALRDRLDRIDGIDVNANEEFIEEWAEKIASGQIED